MNDGDIVL